MFDEILPEGNKKWTCIKTVLIILFAIGMETLNCLLLYHQQDIMEYYNPSEYAILFMKIAEDVHWKVILVIVYFYFPLIQSYAVTLVVLYSVVFSNLFKVWYSPFFFWVSFYPGFPASFRSDYAFISTSLYLSVYRLVKGLDWFKERPCARGWLLFFLIVFLGGMNLLNFYCRLNFVAQIFHEMALGYVIYYVVFHLIELHLCDSRRFFDPIAPRWHNRWHKFFNYWVFIGFLLAIFLSYFEIYVAHPAMKELNFIAFNKALIYFGLMGAYFGISWCITPLLKRYSDKHDEINNWFDGDCRARTKKAAIMLLVIALHFLVWLIPNEYYTLASIFKIAAPWFTVFFCMYGLGIYVIVVTNLGNPEIYSNQQEYQMVKKKKKKKAFNSSQQSSSKEENFV